MTRRPPAAAGLALVLVAALAVGCGSSNSSSGGPSGGSAPASGALSGSINVFAAASLTEVFTDLGRQFEAAHPGTSVRLSFGASSTLAQQIDAGAPADVFASASPTNMEQVTKAGAATDPKVFANNFAEIAVAPASASKVTSIQDLAKPAVKVALCQPQVPCGKLARMVLGKANVTVDPVTQGLDVKTTLGYVTSGEADASMVYVTDVQAAGSKVTPVQIPQQDNASTAYPIATTKASKNTAVAAAFEDLVLSPAGQDALSKAGFAKP